jgi:hypothetical protein
MYPIESTDHRSDELMQKIADKIDLGDTLIFTNTCIEIPYRINGKVRCINLTTQSDIAAFALHNYLIARCETTRRGTIKMYDIKILPATDRRGYPYQCVAEVEVKRIPTLFSRSEIKQMVARYEYDYGDISDFYNDLFVPKGVVREMFPTGTSNNDTKRIA